MNVAHHAAYAPWLEIARTELLRASGISYARLERQGVLLVIVRLEIRYRRPIRYDDVIEVRCAMTRLLRVSCELHYRVDNLRTGKLCVRGSTAMVAVESKTANEPPVMGRIRFDREAFLPRLVDVADFYPAGEGAVLRAPVT